MKDEERLTTLGTAQNSKFAVARRGRRRLDVTCVARRERAAKQTLS